jgi:hypothetical protein
VRAKINELNILNSSRTTGRKSAKGFEMAQYVKESNVTPALPDGTKKKESHSKENQTSSSSGQHRKHFTS